MSLEVLHAVELSVAHSAAEGATARRVKLQPGPPASCFRLLTTLLELLLTLAVVPPQQAGQVEHLTTVLAGVSVAEATVGPCMDFINLWRGFWDGSGQVCRKGRKNCGWRGRGCHIWRMNCVKGKKITRGLEEN